MNPKDLRPGEKITVTNGNGQTFEVTRLDTAAPSVMPLKNPARVDAVTPGTRMDKPNVIVAGGANIDAQKIIFSITFKPNTTGADTGDILIGDFLQLFANNDAYVPISYTPTYSSKMIARGAAQTEVSRFGYNSTLFSLGRLGALYFTHLAIINTSTTTPNATLQSANTFQIRSFIPSTLTSGSPSTATNVFQGSNYQNTNFGNGRYDVDFNILMNGFNALAFQIVDTEAFRLELTFEALQNSNLMSSIQ